MSVDVGRDDIVIPVAEDVRVKMDDVADGEVEMDGVAEDVDERVSVLV